MKEFTVSGVQYRMQFDTAPFPCFMIHRLNNGLWEGGPSYGNYYGGDAVNEFLAEVNAMGVKAWLRKYICPWFRTAFANAYGTPMAPPVAADAPVTTANMSAVFGGALAAGTVTVNADGSVELAI
jgi:hypothetical protein